jgi:hypothetical protein
MTLRAVFDKEKMRSIKGGMPDELLVYKVAVLIHEKDDFLKTVTPRYISPLCCFKYLAGEQSNSWDLGHFTVPLVDQPEKSGSYYPGFHSFVQRTAATKFIHERITGTIDSVVILTCGVLKEWIIAIGIEGDRDLVVVSNRILIPSYPQTDIRYDKNCEWFFEAQSQKKLFGINTKKRIGKGQTEKNVSIYRQNRKHRDIATTDGHGLSSRRYTNKV